MKLKKYLNDYKKEFTRLDLLLLLVCCIVPFTPILIIIFIITFKPHDPNGKWKLKEEK